MNAKEKMSGKKKVLIGLLVVVGIILMWFIAWIIYFQVRVKPFIDNEHLVKTDNMGYGSYTYEYTPETYEYVEGKYSYTYLVQTPTPFYFGVSVQMGQCLSINEDIVDQNGAFSTYREEFYVDMGFSSADNRYVFGIQDLHNKFIKDSSTNVYVLNDDMELVNEDELTQAQKELFNYTANERQSMVQAAYEFWDEDLFY